MKIDKNKPIIVIVGETGSGKTALAIKIAKKYNGELISADSRAVYKFLNIGTAKPTKKELGGLKIWGIDLLEPDQKYTVYEFKKYTENKIKEIQNRNKIPIIVGGSGLYVDSVILNYSFSKMKKLNQSDKLDSMKEIELKEYCNKHNIILGKESNNKRHIISQIRRLEQVHRNQKPEENILVLGIKIDRDALTERLFFRANTMLLKGVKTEAFRVAEEYGWDNESMKGTIYKVIASNSERDIIIKNSVQSDLKLAKKQRTWFRRHDFIKWIDYRHAYREARQEIEKKFYS